MFESPAVTCSLGVSVPPPVGGLDSVESVVAQLSEAPGSPGAIALLAAVDPTHLSLPERVDLIRAWERQLSWVAACQLPVVAALDLPDSCRPELPEVIELPDHSREELASALHLSATAAQSRLDLARDLGGRLHATAAELRAGRLTIQRADVIARAVCSLPDA